MKLSEQIRPISFLKANAAEIARDFSENHSDPLIITQNGEAKMVVMDIDSYQKQQETMALLKILALGNKQIEEGKFQDADSFFAEMDKENQQ
ncbi:type II toxin-antitoxin system Phd/YefM family antitoxin [Undibacterium rugosum]|uniref:Antitoxin n=1 Tax=Undibacterium rugosum TaxID=2762291 RepID=A0A923I288_9BURK|nr:type II toxin-antitoxin system Phd/YefM family antitoxin [Undibacterium rugosum]MBC3936458.1 type II toxin-antitoxin system Phd/YefM family antitoxin [Undibacterium rugosum]MBR7779482.1 type II toxin-antitoxin system Phd/YefM family antitoxin [Undibacterium rugosum]